MDETRSYEGEFGSGIALHNGDHQSPQASPSPQPSPQGNDTPPEAAGGTVSYVPAPERNESYSAQEYLARVRLNCRALLDDGQLRGLQTLATTGSDVDKLEAELLRMLSSNERLQKTVRRHQWDVRKFVEGLRLPLEEDQQSAAFEIGEDEQKKLVTVIGGQDGLVAKGGYSSVHMASIEGDPNMFVFKRPSHESARRIAGREALITEQLSGVAGPEFVHFKEDEGGILMRHHAGMPLKKLEGFGLPRKAILNVGMGIGFALREAHGKGVIHRDLTSNNVLVEDDGTIRLIDFGLSRNVNDTAEYTTGGGFNATPGQFAPEAANQGTHKLTEKADMYCLGVVLYRLLKGKSIFNDVVKGDKEFFDQLEEKNLSLEMVEAVRVNLTALEKEDPAMAKLLGRLLVENYKNRAGAEEFILDAASMLSGKSYKKVDDIPEKERQSMGRLQLPKTDSIALDQPYPKHSRFELGHPERMALGMSEAIKKSYPADRQFLTKKRLGYGAAAAALLGVAITVGVANISRDDSNDKPEDGKQGQMKENPEGRGKGEKDKKDDTPVKPPEPQEVVFPRPDYPIRIKRNESGKWVTAISLNTDDGKQEIIIPADKGVYFVSTKKDKDSKSIGKGYIGRSYVIPPEECMKLMGIDDAKKLPFGKKSGMSVDEYVFPSKEGEIPYIHVFLNGLGDFMNTSNEVIRTRENDNELYVRLLSQFDEKIVSWKHRGKSKNFCDFWKNKKMPAFSHEKIAEGADERYLPNVAMLHNVISEFRKAGEDNINLAKAFSQEVGRLDGPGSDSPAHALGVPQRNEEFTLQHQLGLQNAFHGRSVAALHSVKDRRRDRRG